MLAIGYNFWTEWELAEKVDFDDTNKLIIVYPHITVLDLQEDVWSAWVRHRAILQRGYDRYTLAMEESGFQDIPDGKGGTTKTGLTYFLQNNWKLVVDLSKVAIFGVLYSRDFDTAYFTKDLVPQKPATVSSLVNTAVTKTASLTVLEQTQLAETHGQLSREIYINSTLIINGNGYQQSPYNNWSDAIDDAETNGITALVLMSDTVIDRNIKNFIITGVGLPTIDLAGFDLKNCKFVQCKLEGAFINSIIAIECIMLDNSWLNGFYSRCAFYGVSTCIDGANIDLVDSLSGIAGIGRPKIDMNSTGTCKLSVRSQRGGLDISNCNQTTDEASIEMMAGSVTLESTCTEGQIILRGVGTYINNGTSANRTFEMVRGDHLVEVHQANFNKRVWNKTNNIITIYAEDGITPLHLFDTNSDLSSIIPQ